MACPLPAGEPGACAGAGASAVVLAAGTRKRGCEVDERWVGGGSQPGRPRPERGLSDKQKKKAGVLTERGFFFFRFVFSRNRQ